ncbi:unnamed protein product [Spodoptera exigua]|nr:unnamed protein product [Spodoptera exigua]
MRLIILFSLCLVVVLAAPAPSLSRDQVEERSDNDSERDRDDDDDDDNDEDDERLDNEADTREHLNRRERSQSSDRNVYDKYNNALKYEYDDQINEYDKAEYDKQYDNRRDKNSQDNDLQDENRRDNDKQVKERQYENKRNNNEQDEDARENGIQEGNRRDDDREEDARRDKDNQETQKDYGEGAIDPRDGEDNSLRDNKENTNGGTTEERRDNNSNHSNRRYKRNKKLNYKVKERYEHEQDNDSSEDDWLERSNKDNDAFSRITQQVIALAAKHRGGSLRVSYKPAYHPNRIKNGAYGLGNIILRYVVSSSTHKTNEKPWKPVNFEKPNSGRTTTSFPFSRRILESIVVGSCALQRGNTPPLTELRASVPP